MIYITALDHISLAMPVGGEAEARAYFSDLLGLSEIAKSDDGNRPDGCWFDLGDQQLHLLIDEAFSPTKRAHPAFVIDDLDGLRARIAEKGFSITLFRPSEGRERFFSEDPFGNRIEFISPRERI
ncbi:MAG: glyoxalase [Sphingomonadales bacterium]|nr:glyoxalase [Sphingomonadales bacterium]